MTSVGNLALMMYSKPFPMTKTSSLLQDHKHVSTCLRIHIFQQRAVIGTNHGQSFLSNCDTAMQSKLQTKTILDKVEVKKIIDVWIPSSSITIDTHKQK